MAGETEFLERVLKSNHMHEFTGSKRPTMVQNRELWEVPDKIINIILENKTNEKAWEAFHHFRSLTDGGVTAFFRDSCYLAIKKEPLIFYKRYINGDNFAIERMMDSLWVDLIEYDGDKEIPNYEAEKLYIKIIKLIEKDSTPISKKEAFLSRFKQGLKERHKYILKEWPNLKMPYNKAIKKDV